MRLTVAELPLSQAHQTKSLHLHPTAYNVAELQLKWMVLCIPSQVTAVELPLCQERKAISQFQVCEAGKKLANSQSLYTWYLLAVYRG